MNDTGSMGSFRCRTVDVKRKPRPHRSSQAKRRLKVEIFWATPYGTPLVPKSEKGSDFMARYYLDLIVQYGVTPAIYHIAING